MCKYILIVLVHVCMATLAAFYAQVHTNRACTCICMATLAVF